MPPSRSPASPFDGLGARREQAKKTGPKHQYRRHPLALRRDVLDCITKLECALEIAELNMGWFDALQRYRAHRRLPGRPSGAQIVAAYGVVGLLPKGVRTYARDLDMAFQRIHSYKPDEHLTKGVISLVHSRKRAKSDGAEQVRKLFEGEQAWPLSRMRKKQLFGLATKLAPKSTVYSVFDSVSATRQGDTRPCTPEPPIEPVTR